jgi:hypothetical protein
MHLTEVQLNEYLDNESTDRAVIESHLDSCDECAARLSTLQNLFTELDSLPELELTKSLAAPFTLRVAQSLPAQLPKFLTLTVTLQAAVALTAIILAAPFIAKFIPVLELSSLNNVFIQLQIQWTTWLDMLSQFQLPTLPTFTLELSSIYLVSALAGVFMLWLVGNGLLLRNQIK